MVVSYYRKVFCCFKLFIKVSRIVSSLNFLSDGVIKVRVTDFLKVKHHSIINL